MPPDEPSEVELVAMARRRDPRAGALLWDRYARPMRDLLYRTIGPDAELDDLLQEVFIAFFRSVDGLRDPSALGPFLHGIAIRVVRSTLRKRRVRRWLRLTATGEVPDVPSDRSDAGPRAALSKLHAILGELGDRERLAYVLRHAEGYELTETAEAVGCSLATVKRALARADDHVRRRAMDEPLLQPYLIAQGGGA